MSEYIEFDFSKAIGLVDATKLMRGKGGRAPAVETVRRWANARKGCHPAGPKGPRIVLPTRKVNGEVLVMPQWVEEFETRRAALGEQRGQEDAKPEPIVYPMQSSKQARRAHEAAERRLDAAGIK